ncbi:hypothetical protein [Aquisediminimonas sediminicola]|uniref:hypothetical protein n=1 Tax=Alteraquisediminimonas sediminicola TaxID=2676787 RepID=UPI001C8F08B7|nr:hypothetical protein [Aquisediminimonas sediminicola]
MSVANTPKFGLSGPSVKLDPRTNAVRGDVADIALAGVLFAPHYAKPMPVACVVDHAPIRETADEASAQVCALAKGEEFAVIDLSGGIAWGYCVKDHLVGYVPISALDLPQ